MIHDPFAMTFKVKSAAMLTKSVIGHIPREISRFYGLRWSLRGPS